MSAGHSPASLSAQALRDPLDALWRALRHPWAARILLLGLAGALLIGQLVPQMPPQATSDPAALSRWMADLPAFFRQQASWMRMLGLFDVWRAGWLRAWLALLALALLVTVADQIARLTNVARGGAAAPAEPTASWRLHGTSLPHVVAALRAELCTRRYLPFGGFLPAGGEAASQAELRAARWPAAALAHLGAIVILGGLALDAAAGWQVAGLALAPAHLQALGHGYELTLMRLADGGPVHFVALSRFGRPLGQRLLEAGRPAHFGAITVRQTSLGPLTIASASSASGEPATLEAHPRQGEPSATLELAFGPEQTERYFRSLTSGQAYRVALAGDGLLQVDAYRKRETLPAFSRTVRAGESIELEGETIQFSLSSYAVLDVRSDPAWPMMLGGALLALAGVGLSLICRPATLLWRLRAVGDMVEVELLGAPAEGGRPWLSLGAPAGDEVPHVG